MDRCEAGKADLSEARANVRLVPIEDLSLAKMRSCESQSLGTQF